MEIRCEQCQVLIQIPAERVPRSSAFRLNCPRCKRKILASTKTFEGLGEGKTDVSPLPSPPDVPTLMDDDPNDDLPEAIDCLQPGQPIALLCVNQEESRETLKVTLESLGYVVDIPAAVDHALQRLRFNQYHVIFLDDDLEGRSPNPIVGYLAGLNMNIRRETFVALVGQGFKTGDHFQAFVESVDLILHPDDLPQLATFLTRAMRDHERFYKVFTECLIAAGKKI
jgi:CheY-like chemotaxis protein